MDQWHRQIFVCFFVVCSYACFAQQDSALIKSVPQSLPDTVKNKLLLIANINITGLKRTKAYIVTRELPFKSGDYIHEDDLQKQLTLGKDQVYNTTLFVDVQVYVTKRIDDLLFITVDVKERWYFFPLPYFKLVDRNLNDWIVQEKASLDRVNYGIKFTQNNVTGRNDNFNTSLINGYNREINIKYSQPFADNSLKKGFEVGFDYSGTHQFDYGTDLNKQLFYNQDGISTTYMRIEAAYLYRPAVKTRYSFTFDYISYRLSDSAYHYNPDFFATGSKRVQYPSFTALVQYVDVDNISYPTKGLLGDFSFNKSGINKDVNVWQLTTHFSFSHPFSNKTFIQFVGGGVLKLPFHQSFYTQPLFGYGDIYLQGLEYYVIDGVAGGVFRTSLNTQVLSLNLNTHLKSKIYNKIPFRFYLKTFGNLGYAYNQTPGNSFLNNKLLETGGIGLDIVTVYDIVLKIEYSFNQLGENGLFFHTKTDF